jgi:hypothetical protein
MCFDSDDKFILVQGSHKNNVASSKSVGKMIAQNNALDSICSVQLDQQYRLNVKMICMTTVTEWKILK